MSKYEKTPMPGGIQKLIQVAEHLRANNQDGYIQHQGSLIARFKGDAHRFGKLITCSPFTGSAIGVAFDPKFPRGVGEPYEPLFNGGKDPLPFAKFYAMHNDHDQPAQSLPAFGLGELIDMKKMRRGDQVGIDWWKSAGHSVFVWDVHLDENGDVDCFQMLGAHGPAGASGYGIFVYGCSGPKYLKGKLATGGPGTGSLEKAKDPLFVDSEDVVADGVWFALPGVKKVDTRTFRVTPKHVQLARQDKHVYPSIGEMKVARFHYEGDPPQPYCMKEGGAKAYDPGPPGHADAPVTTIKGNDLKKDPAAPSKVKPQPAKQDEKKPLNFQHRVEEALQELFRAKWIDKDPGSSDNLNDAASQAAIKAFQKLFKLDVDGIVGPITWGMIGKQLPACRHQQTSEVILQKLFKGKKLKTDPGEANGVNDDQTKKAVLEFQKANGLHETGVPDADTFAKLRATEQQHAVSSSQHGLTPAIDKVYWLGNGAAPGGSAKLRVHTGDIRIGHALEVFLVDLLTGKEIDAGVKLEVKGEQSEVEISIPEAAFAIGSWIGAKVKCALEDGKKLEAHGPAPLQVRTEVKPSAGALEKFFTFEGEVGESNKARKHTYVAWRVAGKPQAWLIKGRLMLDVDGAPNAYHPDNKGLRLDYWNFDFENHTGALDRLANGGHPGNWFGVVTDDGKVTGTPVKQGDGDPFPGFYIAASSLVDKSKARTDTKRYVDARKIPYLAWPPHVYAEKGDRFAKLGQGPTGRLGDFITAYNPKKDKVGHCIFADVGGWGDPHFGEGSPALAKLIDAWGGIVDADLVYIVYPHSGAGQGTIPSASDIQDKGDKLFKDWGGLDQLKKILSSLG